MCALLAFLIKQEGLDLDFLFFRQQRIIAKLDGKKSEQKSFSFFCPRFFFYYLGKLVYGSSTGNFFVPICRSKRGERALPLPFSFFAGKWSSSASVSAVVKSPKTNGPERGKERREKKRGCRKVTPVNAENILLLWETAR